MSTMWQALRRGESLLDRRREVAQAHEHFVSTSPQSDAVRRLQSSMRAIVVDAWVRAKGHRVDPLATPDTRALDEGGLEETRRLHPISDVLPVVNRLLLPEAHESGFIVAIGDAEGRLLWVEGDRRMRSQAEDMGFLAGMDWSERAVGMSAPGTALALDHSVQVFGAEHYNMRVHEWSCAAAPVHDPLTGAILGVIDVTGGDDVAAPHILPLIEATVAAAEAELKLIALRGQLEHARQATARAAHTATATGAHARLAQPPRLAVLGGDPAVLECPHGALELTGRHGEILLALALEPNGLSATALAEQVYGDARSEQTLRAEIVRLRKWLEHHEILLGLASRPYRLTTELRIDALETMAALTRGAHRHALTAYHGPVLPYSDAPVAERLRYDIEATLREAMLQQAAPDTLFAYAQAWAADDAEVWQTLLRILPPRSPKRALAVAKLETLAVQFHTL